jgi:hypothetical protein
MRVSKADRSHVVALQRDALAVTDRPILRQQPHLLDLDQGTNIGYHFTAFVRSSETPSGIVWTKGCRFDWAAQYVRLEPGRSQARMLGGIGADTGQEPG